MTSDTTGAEVRRPRGQYLEVFKVQAKLALREPYGLLGLGLPAVLLVVFGYISRSVPGNVAGTGLSVLDLWTPTIMVIAFIAIALSLPSTLVRDRELGWLRRVSTTPVHPAKLLAAQLIILLVLALMAVLIVVFGGELIFAATLKVGIGWFVVALVLSIAEIFSLGLLLAAVAPSQTVSSAISGVLFFLLMFLSGLWVQPAQVGEPLATIMTYSPAGAAVRTLLAAVFNQPPPAGTILALLGWTAVFGVTSVRYFRWE